MNTENLTALKAVFEDTPAMVELANACAKAYCEGCGNPDWYSPFTADDENFAINAAGPQAVLTGIGVLATMRGHLTPDEVDAQVLPILTDIAAGDVTKAERIILHREANGTWGAGQPFRSRTTNVFDLLDPDEVAKDWVQIETAANGLLHKLS
ncbi:hypothetical protein HOB10_01525 [Candidatus Parcubacteria bacterium]|nr:hypothetical protein [Candidatus Parcubacteria bacterium]